MTRIVLLIALAGCWRTQPTPTPPPPVDEPFTNDAPPLDAREREPDPLEATPPIDAGPLPPPNPQRDCPSGQGLVARVIGLSVTGSSTVVTIAAGQQQGVAASWTVSLGNMPCTMIRVDPYRTSADCKLTPDQVKAAAIALLCAP
jgi:hypothetical protein